MLHKSLGRLPKALKALRQLGPDAMAQYAFYQAGLRSGYFRYWSPGRRTSTPAGPVDLNSLPELPNREQLISVLGDFAPALLSEADEIVSGKVRLFGGDPVPLQLAPASPLHHWTAYEKGQGDWGVEDVKYLWEPARFGWAFTLARAYHISGDPRYPLAFWEYTERFLHANPPGMGPNWASAQEVGLRLIAFSFALKVFADSSHSNVERTRRLGQAIADHASRIPSTLAYARSQNNNHLLTEAAGLATAACLLPQHPQAERWRNLGWRWFHAGLQSQFTPDGAYMQNSSNYHRLVLQIALWMQALAQRQGQSFPQSSWERLAAGVRWLLTLVDPLNGQAPNLGPNDGALILPLSTLPFGDYRPTLQAAAVAFLEQAPFSPGPWDEMILWLAASKQRVEHRRAERSERPVDARAASSSSTPHILRCESSWAYMRAARFHQRPGHADQLHLDLWWRGFNLAQDAGTYLYNAPPPWNNALTHTLVHNTLTINGLDQMTYAGRFLWLDWAQAEVLEEDRDNHGRLIRLFAQHNGYRRLSLVHQREVRIEAEDRWLISDRVLPMDGTKPPAQTVTARLHWLLPDWPWEVDEMLLQNGAFALRLISPFGPVRIVVSSEAPGLENCRAGIIRSGQRVYGKGLDSPTLGWVSPTYGQKVPALSFSYEAQGTPPFGFTTNWIMGPEERASLDKGH